MSADYSRSHWETRAAELQAENETLRAALVGLDAPLQWLAENCRKAMVEMPTECYRKFAVARDALAAARGGDAT